MEHKTRKMLALGAVVMLCAVALIGAGYAAFANTATARTYNEGNSTDVGYMTITPQAGQTTGAWDAISTNLTGEASFSTYTYEHAGTPKTTEKAYYFYDGTATQPGSAVTVGQASYYVVELTEAKTFEVDNQTGAALTNVIFGAKAKLGNNGVLGNTDDFKYILKVTGTGSPIYLMVDDTNEATGTLALAIAASNNTTGDIEVQLCIGYVIDCYIPTDFIGDVSGNYDANDYKWKAKNAADAQAPVDMVNVSFAFSVKLP